MPGSSSDSDPLAATMPAPDATMTSGQRPAVTAAPMPQTIGRYKIEGVLGQGAMGTVYAAHDVDLDRRIALKILRGAGSEAARARLLREARAMARLSHPSVVTVHEVGTAAGVDYVAMELIDGITVAEWMRGTPRPSAHDILDAFLAAGRGLAAAHAAGLIHRDFKPHNVLRSKRGRVVVTDFGLARAQLDDSPELGPAAPAGAVGTTTSAGSLTSTLTATGALLGTPAYMAPEQHDGSSAGPAADQFAFCVAVWEGLAGARPFAGETLGELRRAIERGPDPATDAKLPRRLRAPLRRGLSVSPIKRWPNMDALLDAIAPRRRSGYAVAAFAGCAAIALAIKMAMAPSGSAGPAAGLPTGCRAPAVELAGFRTGAAHATLAAAGADGARNARALDRRADEWAAVQPQVCALDPTDPARAARMTCLTAVRTELEVAAAAAAGMPDDLAERDAVVTVSDPSACMAVPPPQRVVPVVDDELVALTRLEISDDAEAIDPPSGTEPCRLARWQLVMFDNPLGTLAGFPDDLGDGCRDDYTLARIAIARAARGALTLFGNNPFAHPAERALARAGGDRYLASQLAQAISPQILTGDFDGGIDAADKTIELLSAAGADALARKAKTELVPELLRRDQPGDLERAEQLARDVLATADPADSDAHRDAAELVASVLWARCALADAHALVAEPPHPGRGSTEIKGRVVDAHGQPVAGASVAALGDLRVDAVALDSDLDGNAATAVTDATGAFTLTGVEDFANVIAELGDLRSVPVLAVTNMTVKLVPTGTLTGHVERDPHAGAVELRLTPVGYKRRGSSPLDFLRTGPQYAAPMLPDGTFAFARVPYGRYTLTAMTPLLARPRSAGATVAIGPKPGKPIELSMIPTGVPISVLVRNQVVGGFSAGMVFVYKGVRRPLPKKFKDLGAGEMAGPRMTIGVHTEALETFARPPVAAETAPAGFVEGDVFATFDAVDRGRVTICAVGISGDILDPNVIRTLKDHLVDLELGCTVTKVKDPDQVIVVEAPAMKRF